MAQSKLNVTQELQLRHLTPTTPTYSPGNDPPPQIVKETIYYSGGRRLSGAAAAAVANAAQAGAYKHGHSTVVCETVTRPVDPRLEHSSNNRFPSASGGRTAARSAESVLAPSPGSDHRLPPSSTPNGSTETASIARPDIRQRDEWSTAFLDDKLDVFALPPTRRIMSSTQRTRHHAVVRYTADSHDRAWLGRRMLQRHSVSQVGGDGQRLDVAQERSIPSRGKTGQFRTAPPPHSRERKSDGDGRGSVTDDTAGGDQFTVTVLEDFITLFELLSFESPEVPLERLPFDKLDSVQTLAWHAVYGNHSSYTSQPHSARRASPEVHFDHMDPSELIEEVKRYWIGKRQARGDCIPLLDVLHFVAREDTQSCMRLPAVVDDYPLPFKCRDWNVRVHQRRTLAERYHERLSASDSSHAMPKGSRKRQREESESRKGSVKDDVCTTMESHDEEKSLMLPVVKDNGLDTYILLSAQNSTECRELQNNQQWDGTVCETLRAHEFLSSATLLTRVLVEREQCKLQHLELALYELSILRGEEEEMDAGLSSPPMQQLNTHTAIPSVRDSWNQEPIGANVVVSAHCDISIPPF